MEEVQKFYEWMLKIGNIHLADNEKMYKAFEQIKKSTIMSRVKAIARKEELMDLGISAHRILNYLLKDHMSGMEAFQAMEDAMEEFFPSDQDED